MGSKRYSNKGVNAAMREQNKPKDKSSFIAILVTVVLILVIAVAIIVAVVVGNTTKPETPVDSSNEATTTKDEYIADVDMDDIQDKIDSMEGSDYAEVALPESIDVKDIPYQYVKIAVKDYGDIIVRLRDDIAPGTVGNFKWLVSEKFYDGLTFHRVMDGFVIQGGCPKGDGTGNSGQWIKGEFAENKIRNDLSHVRGVISMARSSNNMDSASSQFFIMHEDNPDSLDGKYAAFGYVVAGMEVVDAIAKAEVTTNSSGEKSMPVSKIVIESVRFVERVEAEETEAAVVTTAPVEDVVTETEAVVETKPEETEGETTN